ncbi:MAG: LysR substrate-binding domain-containing protein [Anaerolineae bacterium]
MNFHRLRVFYTVARHLSFSRAAEELYTSQPNVSRHIAKLETELGVSLFHRLGTQVALTDAGRMVYDYAQRVFELTEGLQRALNEQKGLERGYLRLGASSTPGLYLLPPHLASFRARYPGLEVTLHLGNSREIVARVLSHALDLGFVAVTEPFDAAQDRHGRSEGHTRVAGLQVRPFATDELVFIAPMGHRLAGQAELEPQNLADETLIWREQGSGTREAMEAVLSRLGIQPARSLELRGCEGVKRAVAAGLGISFVSKHAVELELAQGLLTVLEGPDTSATPVTSALLSTGLSRVEGLSTSLRATQELSIVSHKDVRPSAAALAFLAHLRKAM